jgi:hypothetical protein
LNLTILKIKSTNKFIFITAFIIFSLVAVIEVSATDSQSYVLKEKTFVSNKSIIIDDRPIKDLKIQVYNQTWLEFDGVDDYVETLNDGSLDFDIDSNYTFSVWVYLNGGIATVYSQGELYKRGVEFAAGSGKTGFGIRNLKDNTLYSVNGIEANKWTHILCTYNGAGKEIKCYINGVLISEESNNFNWDSIRDSNNSEARLGHVLGSDTYLKGSISNLFIFNRILSPLEIKNLYQSKSSYYVYSINKSYATFNASTVYRYNDTRYYALFDSYLKKSDDGGKTWANIKLLTLNTETIFIDSKKNIFLTTVETGNISRSNVENDKEWTEISVMQCKNEYGEGWGYGTKWGFTETKDGTLLLGEYGQIDVSKRSCSFIHRSTDGGLTWEIAYDGEKQFPEAPGRHIHIVRTDPYTGYIYATQGDGSPRSRLLKSTNDGKTWESLENISDTSQYLSLVFTSKYRVLGTDKGKGNKIIRTKDDKVFEEVFSLPDYADGYIWDMKRDEKSGFIIAGTQTISAGKSSLIIISPDNGTSWFSVYEKMQNSIYRGVTGISEFNSGGYSYYYDNDLKASFYFNLLPSKQEEGDLSLNFNENSGTIAHDSSGNGNDGVISGASWKNNGIVKTLKEGIDYTFNGKTGELIPSDEYLYTWFNVTYYVLEDNPAPPVVNDTTPPVITSTSPTSGLTNGSFSVRYIEENPKELWLVYGTATDKRVMSINLNLCSKKKDYTECNVRADLSEFDGKKISYNFHLADIAGNYNDSKEISLKVDVSPPVLNDLEYSVRWRRISYYFDISEPNFKSVTYKDTKNGATVSSGTLCNYLAGGICTASKSLSKGSHTINIQILDKAGNSDSFELNVAV